MKFCIVTPDLLGPVRNGGIGTACTNLARTMASAGHEVSILFSQTGTTATRRDAWVKQYTKLGIQVTIAQEWIDARPSQQFRPSHPPLVMSHHVHQWLRDKHFDVINFMDWQGHGFYSLQAKRAGQDLRKSSLVVHIHSPSLWHDMYNNSLPRRHQQVLTYFMERKCIELADIAVSPSRYMYTWLKSAGYTLPRQRLTIPNLIDAKPGQRVAEPLAAEPVHELVFFGRLEYRKGLVQFCDALDRLATSCDQVVDVTFLGKFSYVGDTHAAVYIANRARNWPFPVKILSHYDQAMAIAYLKQAGKLAVMPAVMDNFPYTVYECLTHRIPFVARNAGGTAELIAANDHARTLFSDNPESLRNLLEQALGTIPKVPKLAFRPDKPHRLWTQDFLAQCTRVINNQPSASKAKLPFITVCLTHYNRPDLLRQALDSLRAQHYRKFDVVLVDDGSDGPALKYLDSLRAEFKRRKWRMVCQSNGYLGKARNAASQLAKGDYLLFMDDDNVAMPHMLGSYAQAAAAANADIVTSAFNLFSGVKVPGRKTSITDVFLPVGDCLAYATIANVMGDANSLFRTSTFRKLGGFTEDYGVGHEDHELLIKATLANCRFSTLDSTLFWYRKGGNSMLANTSHVANHTRSMRPLLGGSGAARDGEMAVLAHMQNPMPDPTPYAIQGDPESPQALVQACTAMHAVNMAYLAGQLASTIDNNDFKQLYRANSALFRLAASGSTVSAMRKPQPAAPTASNGYTDEQVELIAATYHQSVDVALLAANYYLDAGKALPARSHIERLLALSDKEYRRIHSDIEQAVQRGEFEDGIHHYIIHGAKENRRWPNDKLLQSLCQRHPRQLLKTNGDNRSSPYDKFSHFLNLLAAQ